MSAAAVAVECALRRTRTRKGRMLALVAAIAVGIAGLLLVSVARTIAGDRALQHGVDGLDPEERAFTVSAAPDVTPTAEQLAALNATIAGKLSHRGLTSSIRTIEYRALAGGDGRIVRFAGIDDLDHVTHLASGSYPTRCDATRCEVVAVVTDTTAPPVPQLPADNALGLTITGTVVATSPLLLEGQLRPDPGELKLITNSVASASALPALELFRRTYAWQVPIDSEALRSVDIGPILDGVRALSNDPGLTGLTVSGPEDQLRGVVSRTRITANRLAVPVGALLVLFFGVAALAGLGGRADHQRAVQVLRRRGAGGRAIALFRALEAGVPLVLGTVLGAGIAVGAGVWLGHHAGLGGWSIVGRSLSTSAWAHALEVAAGALLLIVAVLGVRDIHVAVRRRLLASDVAGLAALAVLLVLIERGSISTGSLSTQVDPTLVAVPVLAAIAVAAVVIRVVPAALRVTSNASPRRWPLTKLTLAEATAQPLRSIATASLIAVTVMFSLLTFGYASTLRLGSRDQAAFAVPYDFRLQLGADLVRPQQLAPAGGWSALAPGTTATDVLRRGVALRTSPSNVQTVELIGLDPTTLGSLHGWRDSFGPNPRRLAKDIDVARPAGLGTTLPADATTISFVGTGLAGLHTSAVIQRVDGTWHELTLDQEDSAGVSTALSPGDAGGQIIGLRLAQPADVSARVEHHVGEGNTDAEARPVDVLLQRVQTTNQAGESTTVSLGLDKLHAANAVLTVEDGTALHIVGSLIGVAILVAPSGPGQDVPLQAVVDPDTARAARNGVAVLETSNGTIQVHPIAVVDRFPGAGSRFAIIDVEALQPALDLIQPGAGTSTELWLAANSPANEKVLAGRLDRPDFASVAVDRRSARQTALATEPLAVVTLLILSASALVAVVLGAFAVLFGAAADARDERPLLRMLALERIDGKRLMAMVAGKSLAVILAAIPLGLLAGRWLLQIATRLVAVSATSGHPNPDLRLSVPWALVAVLCVALVAVLVVSATAGATSARRVPNEDLMRGTA